MKHVHELVGLFVLVIALFLLSFKRSDRIIFLPIVVHSQAVNSQQNVFPEIIVLPKQVPKGSPIDISKLEIKPSHSSGFGYRINPISKKIHFHMGIDLSCPKGTLVKTTATGIVVRVQHKKTGYGNNVVIKHTNENYQTLYAHLDKIWVEPGDTIFRNQVVGTVGNTGLSTRPHLHYEVFVKGKRKNPLKFIEGGS